MAPKADMPTCRYDAGIWEKMLITKINALGVDLFEMIADFDLQG